jgi:hypothetical protein
MPLAKKYKAAIALFDRDTQFTPTEAAELVKKTASASSTSQSILPFVWV